MLFDVVIRQLGYAWTSEDQKLIVQDLIGEGLAYLARYDPSITHESVEADFFARSLLVEYVRYALSNARDDFSDNYRKEIFSLSDRGRIHRAKQKAKADDRV